MNVLKLKGKIAEKDMTLTQIAEALNINLGTLSRKMSGETEFKRSEIERIRDILNLDWEETRSIFFCA